MTKVYLNTSVLIAAAWTQDPRHKEALELLRKCKERGMRMITGNMTLFELEGKRSERLVKNIMRRYGITVVKVNLKESSIRARRIIKRLGLSPRREPDVIHVLTAIKAGVSYLVTYDRKLRSLSRKLGLKGCYPRELLEELKK